MDTLAILRQFLGHLLKGYSLGGTESSMQQFDQYLVSARKLGLSRPHLFLSFDCDTDLDATASEEVHFFLESLGIKATYAVPGAQLLKSPEPYQRLGQRGAEFINHGGLPHTEWTGDQWIGITFYDTMSPVEVEADIQRGHEIVTEVIGRAPMGFRAPHFGCYQAPEQLDLLHRTASNLGYRYCTTTLPSLGLKNGPVYHTHGLLEIPCFGSIRNPTTILDSWTYLTDRKNYALGEQYRDLMIETVDTFVSQQLPVVFTWYADPCHVLNQPPFMRAMEHLAKSGVVSVAGAEMASMLSKNSGYIYSEA
jgi:peptidoglycan/xylan/chitin deacetylase (PgdA/CDA1 family)